MTTLTTNHLSLSRRARLRVWLATRDPWSFVLPLALALIASLIALALAFQLYRTTQPAAAAAQPTLAPIIIVATARAEARPTPAPPTADESKATPIGHVLARAVVAYDAPAGKVIGAIDRGHPYTVVARFGADWLQADVQGSGVVWLATTDVFDLPQGLADLAPTLAPQIVTVRVPVAVAQPAAAPEPPYQVDSASPPADAPLGSPPTPFTSDAAVAADRAARGLSDADMDQALSDHQAAEAASCDAGRIANASYCAAVKDWLEAH